jgi:peptidoglycan/xylan/chitin deacetylase (PgdA/CDA1 family)
LKNPDFLLIILRKIVMVINTSKILIGFSVATLASAVVGISFALIQSNLSKDVTDANSQNNLESKVEIPFKKEQNTKENYQPNTSLEKNLSIISPSPKTESALTPQLPREEEKKFIQGRQYFNEAEKLFEQAINKQDSNSAINLLNDAQKNLDEANHLMSQFNLNSSYYSYAQKYISAISNYSYSINDWKNHFAQLDLYQARINPFEASIQNNNFIDLTYSNKKYVMQKAKKKSVVLTFDDGPSPDYTEPILDILKKYNVKATFFVVGSQVQKHCNLLRRIYSEGHEIGNHSYNHPWMAKISSEEQQNEILQTQGMIQSCIGSQPRWFRSPYASQNESTLQIAHQAGLNTALWTIDTQDWRKSSTTQSIIQKALNYQTNNIILMHDGVEPNPNFKHPEASLTRNNTVQSLETIIQRFQNNGFQFLTISEVFSGN